MGLHCSLQISCISNASYQLIGSLANIILSISVYSSVSASRIFQSSDSSFYAEEIKHVITNKDEPSELAKRAFGSGVKSTTKVGFAIDSNMEGATVSKESGLNQKRIESSGTSSTPRSCWVVKGTSPVLVSQEVFSLAANMVTTSCSSQGTVTKHSRLDFLCAVDDNSFAEEANVMFHRVGCNSMLCNAM